MGAWGPGIYSDDLALDIKREYNVLLSIGEDASLIENKLISYYSDILGSEDPDGEVFWFALALCEWEKGRLSSYVKDKAIASLESGRDLARWDVPGNRDAYLKRKKALDVLRQTIISPMPDIKTIKKPTLRHCPWQVGSLLAYRIVSNVNLIGNPCYNKYVLLRIVRIDKHPLSKLFDTGYYNETMKVGLYNWMGSTIPDSNIVESLPFIPISSFSLSLPIDKMNLGTIVTLPDGSKITEQIKEANKIQDIVCVQLDWRSKKNEIGDITFLNCDNSYQDEIPVFFRNAINNCPMSHFIPFDATLYKIFKGHIPYDSDFVSITI